MQEHFPSIPNWLQDADSPYAARLNARFAELSGGAWQIRPLAPATPGELAEFLSPEAAAEALYGLGSETYYCNFDPFLTIRENPGDGSLVAMVCTVFKVRGVCRGLFTYRPGSNTLTVGLFDQECTPAEDIDRISPWAEFALIGAPIEASFVEADAGGHFDALKSTFREIEEIAPKCLALEYVELMEKHQPELTALIKRLIRWLRKPEDPGWFPELDEETGTRACLSRRLRAPGCSMSVLRKGRRCLVRIRTHDLVLHTILKDQKIAAPFRKLLDQVKLKDLEYF